MGVITTVIAHGTTVTSGVVHLASEWLLPPWLLVAIVRCLGSVSAGVLGGIVSHILAMRRMASQNKDFHLPHGWQYDVKGDVIIGIAVGVVVYALGRDVPYGDIIVAAVTGGVSGGKYFNRDQEVKEAQRQSKIEKAKSKVFKEVADKAVEPVRKKEKR